jgi:hypothetical protein
MNEDDPNTLTALSTTRARRLDDTLWPPFLAWGAAVAVVAIAALAFGFNPARSATWARWDSFLYLDVGRDGYDLFRCGEAFAAGTWCGDAGWFPAYPWLFGALAYLGLPIKGTAVVISWLFAGATLVLLWVTFLGRRVTTAALVTLAYVAFGPGQIYDYALFPTSMLAFFTVACLWLLHRERWVAAGCAGAVAALAYPLGLLLAAVAAVWLLVDRRVPIRERLRRVAVTAGLTMAGGALLILDQWLETGRWNAYFLVQAKYDVFLRSPIQAMRIALQPLRQGPPLELAKAPALQTAFVTLVVVLVVGSVLIRSARQRSLDRLDLLLVLWAVATWMLPVALNNISLPRSQAALLPLALLVGRLPSKLAVPVVIAALVLAVAMEKLFLQSVLV